MLVIQELISSIDGVDTYREFDGATGVTLRTYIVPTPMPTSRQITAGQIRSAYERLAQIKTQAEQLQGTSLTTTAAVASAVKQVGDAVGDVAFYLAELAKLTLDG